MSGLGKQPSVTFPEMLQALARQGATGVLNVQGSEGWKVLEIQAGAIALVSAVSGKRLRVGDILLARGKISQEVLAKALATHRSTGAPLGEILIQRGFITQQELQEIMHFQLEEEVYDVFTWRGAECTFEPGATIGDQLADYPQAMNFAVDTQKLFVEAANRIPVWQQIERTIYSAYMVFRLTERGKAMLATATRSGRRLLELVQQEYCVDTIVHKAMVGRFAIWKALSDLVDAQAIAAAPDSELADLAGQWETQGKLEQARGAYLRLAETTTDTRRIEDFRRRAEALWERLRAEEEQALLEAEQAGEFEESSSRYRTTVIVLAVIGAVVMLLVLAPAVNRLTRRASGEDIGAFQKAGREAQKLTEEGDLAGAMALWDEFLAERPEGTAAELAKEARQNVHENYEKLVQAEIGHAKKLVDENKFVEALDLYDSLPRKYPRTRKQVLLSELRRAAERKRDAYTEALEHEELVTMLASGRKMLEQKRYGEAREALQTVVKSRSAGALLREQAREEMKVIEQIEAKAEGLVRSAQAKEREGRLDDAIEIYNECAEMWFTSASGQEAARRMTVLGRRRARAERFYRQGVGFIKNGDTIGAQKSLREAAGFEGFAVAVQAAQKLKDMASERERVAELLDREKRLRQEDKLDEAFKVIVEIADRFPRSAARLNLKLEVSIETVPPGARVFLGNRELGHSPITVRVSPEQSGTLQLRKPGFVTLRKNFDQVRERVMRFRMQKQIAYRVPLAGPIFSAAALGRPEDERVPPILIVQAGPEVVAFTAANGKTLWRVEPGEPPTKRVRPVTFDETVFVLGGNHLSGYSLAGSQRIRAPVVGVAATSPAPVRLRLLANRTFAVLACADGRVMSLGIMERKPRWESRVNPPVNYDLLADEKAAFVPSGGEGIAALGILDGKRIWTSPIPGEAGGDLAMGPRGDVVGVVTSLGEAYLLSTADGQVKMRVPLDRARGGGMALTEDTAFVGTDEGRLRAIDIAASTVKWSVGVQGAIRAAPTLHGQNVYVGTEEGRIVCVSTQSGRIEWSFDAEAPITASGTVCGDKIVYGTHDGELIGIDLGDTVR